MWLAEFERLLNKAFTTYNKRENRVVHSNQMKLRILCRKVNADFLQSAKAAIQLELAKTPMTMTYDNAMSSFRDQVNLKYPPELSTVSNRNRARRVGQTSVRGGGRSGFRGGGRHAGRVNSRYGGRGRGGYHSSNSGRGNGNPRRRGRDDARMVRCVDGTNIEVHPAYKFTDEEWNVLPHTEKSRILRERESYKRNRSSNDQNTNYTTVSELTTNTPHPNQGSNDYDTINQSVNQLSRQVSAISSSQNNNGNTSSGYSSIMGGRNEQASLRSRNSNNIGLSTVITHRQVAETSSVPNVEQPIPGVISSNEMDSNADTCCAGSNFVVLQMTRRTADVYPYDVSNYKPIYNVPIVSAATAYDDPITGKTYILVLHECLYYGSKLQHSLFNPNQLRFGGTPVWDNPFDLDHNLCIECDHNVEIPLQMEGTKIYFQSRSPSSAELSTCVHIDLNNKDLWEPSSVQLRICSTNTAKEEIIPVQCQVNQVTADVQYSYNDLSKSECILHEIEPSLVSLSELQSELQEYRSQEYKDFPDDIPARRTFTSNERHKKLDAMALSEKWGIGLKRAEATLLCTTQRGTRSAILPLSRRYRADRMYNLKRLDSKFATDTFFSDIKSLNQNTCAQLFSHKVGFTAVYPMEKADGESIGQAFLNFVHDFGIPELLTFDGASAQVGKNTLFMRSLRKYECKYHVSSPRRPNENPAEAGIRETKKRWYRIMQKMKVPRRLWDFGIKWICETGNLIATSSKYSDGRTPIEIVTGDTPDISEYADFTFYDWVTYRPNAGLGESCIGRWIGVSHKIGQLMSYWIMPVSGIPVSCTTVQRLTTLEKQTDEWKQRMSEYDEKLGKRLKVVDEDISSKIVEIDQWNKLSITDIDQEFDR